jgi:hypothetical protein
LSLALVLLLGSHSWVSATGATALTYTVGAKARTLQIERGLAWFFPVLTASLMFFHVHVPGSGGTLNVNLADPVAVGGGLVFLTRMRWFKDRGQLWRVSHFEVMLLAATLVLTFGLVNGWLRHGYSDWAVYNRFIGWFVLLSYLATGALIAGTLRGVGFKVLLRCLLAGGIAVALLDLAILAAIRWGMEWQVFLPLGLVRGMSQNANAFAIMMTALIAIFCALNGRVGVRSRSGSDVWPVLLLTVLLLSVSYSLSRSGWVTSVAVLLIALVCRWVSLRLVVPAVVMTATVIYSPVLVELAYYLLASLGAAFSGSHEGSAGLQGLADANAAMLSPLRVMRSSSDVERWTSISRGLDLWLQHPLLGNGLGAFVAAARLERGAALVIHNSSVWLLAELGLVGFAIFATVFAALLKTAWLGAKQGELWGRLLVLVLLSFLLFHMVHDVFYQRIFWLLFGATLFAGTWGRLQQAGDVASARDAGAQGVAAPHLRTADLKVRAQEFAGRLAPGHRRGAPSTRSW